MFVRAKRSVGKGGEYEYLQIVRSVRDGQKVRQEIIGTLGRRDRLLASGELDGLLQSLAKFAERLRVVEAAARPDITALSSKQWGPALIFGRLWERQEISRIMQDLAHDRKFEFDVERVCFAMALQRLCCPGSDLQGSSWIDTVEARGFDHLALQHFYRTCTFLADVRHSLEQALFWKDRDLFNRELDLVFIDTTSLFVYGNGERGARKRGYSRDRRGDLPQYVLCVAVDKQGWPMAWEVLPGNTADKKAFGEMVAALRKRFAIGHVCVVADRGMISTDAIEMLTADSDSPYSYIFGCRMRRQKEVTEQVLARAGRYQVVDDNLEVKEVFVDKRRYVVCRNPIEAKADQAAREALLEKLERTLAEHGPKAVIGNRGYARFLKIAKDAVSINQEAIQRDQRLDGKFVLTTNTDMPATEVALTYKSLWRVERTFREQKSTLEVRPIYHHRDDTSIGHIVASFLALRLEVDLQKRLDDRGVEVSWPDLMRDLGRVHSVVIDLDGKRYQLRTQLVGSSHQAFQAAGVRPPTLVTELGPSPQVLEPTQLVLM
jgi:hypothetical protein